MGFFSDLMGKTSARSAQQLGQRNASQINSSFDQANDYATTGYGAAQGRYAPYAAQGQKAYGLYADSYGVNGDDARRAAFQTYQSDPFSAHSGDVTNNLLRGIMRQSASRGMGNSGATQLAMSRAGLEAQDRRIADWRGGLQGLGNTGLQVAGAQAGLDMGHYGGMADRAIGRGKMLVDNDTNATMASNNARMSGVNNLLRGLGSLGGSMFSAFAPGATGGGSRPWG